MQKTCESFLQLMRQTKNRRYVRETLGRWADTSDFLPNPPFANVTLSHNEKSPTY
jgi:hypothetical protein